MTGEYERIRPALKEAACLLQTWLEAEQEPDRSHDWYALHKKLEYLLYDIGGVIYDLEVRSDEALAPKQEALPMNPTEKKVFRDYLTRFQVGTEPFLFEPYANDYRAVLPYLLNRRASERVYYSPKRKYVVNVFETLLRKNRSTIKRMPAVTVCALSCRTDFLIKSIRRQRIFMSANSEKSAAGCRWYYIMSMVLYNLYREGFDFSNRLAELSALFDGSLTTVEQPFFVSAKEMTYAHSRLNTTYGSRLYGAIVTAEKFYLLYAPSTEKNLHARIETGLYQSMKTALSEAAAPYNLPANTEYLYFYLSHNDLVDSFSELGKRSVQTASTCRMYQKSVMKQSHIYRMNCNTYRLTDLFDENRRRAINAVFMEYYEVKPRMPRYSADAHICGYYRNTDIPVYMVWDLSPSALVSAMDYTRQKGFGIEGKVYMMCFEEDSKAISDILNNDRRMAKHFAVCDLPYHEVIRYINGEIERIE